MAVLFHASVAQAVLIENLTTTTTLFSDDFETGTVGLAPDNGAAPGTWSGGGGNVNQVTNAVSPGPAEGAQYWHLQENASSAAGSADFTDQTTVGQNIRLAFSFNMREHPSTGNGYARVSLDDGTNGTGYWIFNGSPLIPQIVALQFEETAGGINVVVPQVNTAFGTTLVTTVTKDEWHTAVMDYNIGDSTYTVIIDGITYSNQEAAVGNRVNLATFSTANTNSLIYFDAIPEPSSAALVGIGVLAMGLRRAKR